MVACVSFRDRERLLHRPVVFDVIKVRGVRITGDVWNHRRHRVADRLPRPRVVLEELGRLYLSHSFSSQTIFSSKVWIMWDRASQQAAAWEERDQEKFKMNKEKRRADRRGGRESRGWRVEGREREKRGRYTYLSVRKPDMRVLAAGLISELSSGNCSVFLWSMILP